MSDEAKLAARLAEIDAMEARVKAAPDKNEALITEMHRLLDERDAAWDAGAKAMQEWCVALCQGRALYLSDPAASKADRARAREALELAEAMELAIPSLEHGGAS